MAKSQIDTDASLALLLAMILFFVMLFLGIAFSTFLVYVAWNLFLVPVFGIAAITAVQAFAGGVLLGIVKRLFTRRVVLAKS